MTTAIYFDLDETLLRFERSYGEILTEVFETELGHVSEGMLGTYDETFFAAFDALEPDPVRTGMDAVLTEAGIDGDPDALAEALLTVEKDATTVPDGTHESLEALGESNRLAVITNGVGDWQQAKLAHHDLLDYFETVVTSYDVGAHKPDSAPFEEAKRRVEAAEYVMVGDDDEADVEGGRAAGFVPVRIEDDEGTPEFWATLRAMV
jgi:putative hydrolase of the HAD superfamily